MQLSTREKGENFDSRERKNYFIFDVLETLLTYSLCFDENNGEG